MYQDKQYRRPPGLIPLLGCSAILLCAAACTATRKGPVMEPVPYTWGCCDYESLAGVLETPACEELDKPIDRRSRDAGVRILDYASACLAANRIEQAQKALYEAILITNDLTLGEAEGQASLFFDEALKTWQGEAYERAMVELLHGICLMQQGDFENARVAFDRAIMTDHFSKGAIAGIEGSPDGRLAFSFNEECSRRGASLMQRDFLAAYMLRTLAYIRQGRMKPARASWEEARRIYREMVETATASLEGMETKFTTWTGPDGRYMYPSVYLPPFPRWAANDGRLFNQSIEELAGANLLVVVATGSRPRKVKAGVAKLGGDAKYVHDSYLPPAETIEAIDLLVDGRHAGPLTHCLNLYGQAAGRGPSMKDRAQERKELVENIGEMLEKHGSYGLQYAGTLIRVLNQEKADTRQWTLLPNSIHLWVGKVPPGTRRLCCLPTGGNAANQDPLLVEWLAPALQTLEKGYVAEYLDLHRPEEMPTAVRHARFAEVDLPAEGLRTVFLAERFEAHVRKAPPPVEPRVYRLKPRRTPPK